jgi:probable phosphoglycerate mutase
MAGEDNGSGGVPARLVIARHGETEGNRAGVHQGHTDSPLTVAGRSQAEELGDELRRRYPGASGVYSSPLSRALSTATVAAGPLGLSVMVEPDLIEGSLGDWEGLPSTRFDQLGFWANAKADPDYSAPGGESFRACGARAAAAFERLAGLATGSPVIVVTHQGPICQGLATLLETPLPGFEYGLGNGGFCEIVFGGEGATRSTVWRPRPVNR